MARLLSIFNKEDVHKYEFEVDEYLGSDMIGLFSRGFGMKDTDFLAIDLDFSTLGDTFEHFSDNGFEVYVMKVVDNMHLIIKTEKLKPLEIADLISEYIGSF